MKYLLLFLLLAPVTFGQSIQDRVSKFEKPKEYLVGYDKFKKVTKVIVDRIYLTRDKKSRPFESTAYLWIYDDGIIDIGLGFTGPLFSNDTLRVLADGELIECEDDTIGYSTIVLIPAAKMAKIINAKVVEMQIHGIEGKVSDKDLVRLRNLFSLTKPQ